MLFSKHIFSLTKFHKIFLCVHSTMPSIILITRLRVVMHLYKNVSLKDFYLQQRETDSRLANAIISQTRDTKIITHCNNNTILPRAHLNEGKMAAPSLRETLRAIPA
jgi:hypothetical protein